LFIAPLLCFSVFLVFGSIPFLVDGYNFFGPNSLMPYYYVISLNFFRVGIKVWKDCKEVTNLCVDCSAQHGEVSAISFVTDLFLFGMCPQRNSQTQLRRVEVEGKGVRKDKSNTSIGVSPEFRV